ncbi:24656_t:CDS:2 [Dentiscutata erythropus]|uniref:24656_t:CDS:1 n=1 Tax=Dentiscutata erythropus TaxID=1348616 RepID=A0A9N9AM83_9GLOM|nr:24656_t:CDS:2 [Dentiscutata erythropus]
MSSDKEKSLSHTAIPISRHETSQIPPSSKSKFFFLFTKEFFFILLWGQFISLCCTGSIVIVTALTINHHISLPATLSFFMYTTLTLIYTPITIYKNGIRAYLRMLKIRGWKYFLLAFVDVEANYFGIKAYAYTSILSTILLDAWSIPVCVILSILFLRVKYHWSQYLGVGICLAGIGVLIEADFKSGKDMYYAVDPIKGDILCLISATFFGISNVIEEYYVRKRPAYEVLGQMGFWGMIISGIHVAILERSELTNAAWTGPSISLAISFVVTTIMVYVGLPLLLRLSSATFFNLSFLTSDFYTLIFSWFLFKTVMHVLYPLAAVCTILGLLVFYIYPATQPVIKCDDEDSIEYVVSDEETAATNTSESVRALNRSL